MKICITINHSFLLTIILVLGLLNKSVSSADASENDPKNPCTLVKKLAGSATKCITSSGGKVDNVNINVNSPADVIKLLNSDALACMVKCVMTEQGLIGADGKIDPSGVVSFQENIPEEMKSKLSLEELRPCLELAGKFDPNVCRTYSEFSQCQLRLIVKAFDPSALDCFTKIPGVGRLFAMLQSVIPATQQAGKHFNGLRERISQGGFRDWIQGNNSVSGLIRKIDF